MAKLLDIGNLVLIQQDRQRVAWQSFDYPTDTVLPFMKLGLDRRTGLNRFLTSWKSKDDPGTGNCSCRIIPIGYPQMYLYRGRTLLWRIGSWTGLRWSGIPRMSADITFNNSFVNNQDEITIMSSPVNLEFLSKAVLDESGILQWSSWHNTRWVEYWSAPQEFCDKYLSCGPNSYCNPYNGVKFECTCFPGFEPKSSRDWYLRDGSGGCLRKKQGVSICNDGEGFVKVEHLKVPDTLIAHVNISLSLKECEQECLKNCSCTAYASTDEREERIGCLTWHGDLVDSRIYSDAGQDLYIRVDAVIRAKYAKKNFLTRKKRMLAILGVSVAVLFLLVVLVVYWLLMRKKINSPSRRDLDGTRRNSNLPLFDLRIIIAATDNFSITNKLGQGGFGPVYKGLLQNGMEIAVKRLSKCSGQGIEQFKTEVALIAKLQHRNLVRILGCCIHKDEKMLIYEYLPNKSLDSFIFNETKRIVGGDQIEVNTNCVVGTYGYMSPEYAMQGLFSIKSDVYSFGVLLLEIISGKKNSTYDHDGPSSNLIGHVWDLWREDSAFKMVDRSLDETYPSNEVSRCIQIGLLCVQEHAIDRPTMSTVVFMLGNDTPLPSPKQPAFIVKGTYNGTDKSTNKASNSINEITLSRIDGR
nr:g-type lectin s-receptor-like serine/threonine-protein kinase rks1 [Quercus suber]